MFHCALWAGTGDLSPITGLCSLRRTAGRSPFLPLAKLGVFLPGSYGLAADGSHEGSKICVLQQCLALWWSRWRGSYSPYTEHWVGSSCASWHELPRGVETSHVPGTGIASNLGNDSLLAWDWEHARMWEWPAHVITKKCVIPHPCPFVTGFGVHVKLLSGLNAEISKVCGQHSELWPQMRERG